MAQGTIKWFDPKKGYGFIKPDDGSKDAFLHISALEKACFDANYRKLIRNWGNKVNIIIIDVLIYLELNNCNCKIF